MILIEIKTTGNGIKAKMEALKEKIQY